MALQTLSKAKEPPNFSSQEKSPPALSKLLKDNATSGELASTSLNQILRSVRSHLGMEVGFVSEFKDGCRVFRYVEHAEGKTCLEVGGSDPLEDSYCHWIVKGRLPQLIRDPADHPFTAKFPATKSLPVGAHLSVPVYLRNGKVYGTFCCFSSRPDPSLTDRDLAIMRAFADVIGEQIQQTLDVEKERRTKLRRIKSVLSKRNLHILYQPAVRIDRPGVEFAEALSRFEAKPYESPDKWFRAANEVGLGIELEMLAVRLALEGLAELPPSMSISINASPQTIISSEFSALLASAALNRIILEVTEQEAVHSYPAMIKQLNPLRKDGLRLAVDDMGAGFSSFQHLLDMRPDIIKLDMSLSRGIDSDPARRALASALIVFAKDIGSDLVAEGVETSQEMRSLRGLGVTIIQGYYISRPVPSAEISQFQ